MDILFYFFYSFLKATNNPERCSSIELLWPIRIIERQSILVEGLGFTLFAIFDASSLKKKTQLHVCYTDLNLDHELFFLYN